jgi:hypothetical protein
MRKSLVGLGVVVMLTACGTTRTQTVAGPIAQPVLVSTPVNVQEISAQRTVTAIPDWFLEVPRVDGVIHSVGDGVSSSLAGALSNARANAYEGICQSAGGTVRSQTKVYRQDTESSSTSMTTTAIRNLCPDVDVTGASVERRKIIQDGSRFRAFVLVALPMGEKNTLARTKQADKIAERAAGGAEREFKELDELTEKSKTVPQSQVAPVQVDSELKLMDVDNAEYKARRDAALQKPGAVIGQTVLR